MIRAEKMDELLEKLSGFYDYIVLDTPPVLSMDDGVVLASKCDGTILVTKSGLTKRKEVVAATKELKRVEANILGSVLNESPDTKKKYKYYY